MSNIVEIAINAAYKDHGTDQFTVWTVTFGKDHSLKGQLKAMGHGHYHLEGVYEYYFSADKVVFLTPSLTK